MAKKTPMIKSFIDCMCTIIMHTLVTGAIISKSVILTHFFSDWICRDGLSKSPYVL